MQTSVTLLSGTRVYAHTFTELKANAYIATLLDPAFMKIILIVVVTGSAVCEHIGFKAARQY